MGTATNERIQMDNRIKISAALWAEFVKLKSEKSALDKREKEILAEFKAAGLPDASEENKGQVFIFVNGNGDEMGTVSFFFHPGAKIPPGFRRRIS